MAQPGIDGSIWLLEVPRWIYIVVGSVVVVSSLTLLIKVSGPANQTNVKSIAESVIASRKDEYSHIIVKTYAEGMTASDAPFAISRLEDGTITHRFNSMAETQKIPTH